MLVVFPQHAKASAQFAALSSPVRRELLSVLACAPMRLEGLEEYVEVAPSTIYHHLRVLEAAGLVRRRWPRWELNEHGVERFESFVHSFFHERPIPGPFDFDYSGETIVRRPLARLSDE